MSEWDWNMGWCHRKFLGDKTQEMGWNKMLEHSDYKPGQFGLFFFGSWRTFENLQSTEYPTHIQKIGRRVAIGKQLWIVHKIPRDFDSHVLSGKSGVEEVRKTLTHFLTSSNRSRPQAKKSKRKTMSIDSVCERTLFFLNLSQSKTDKFQQKRKDLADDFL